MYLKKAFKLITKNLVIILPILIVALIFLFLLNNLINALSPLSSVVSETEVLNIIKNAMLPMLIYFSSSIVLSLIVQAGQGNMIKEAMRNGETDFSDFSAGIKHYFWRVVGQFLLTMAMTLAICVIIGIIMIALVAGSAFTDLMSPAATVTPNYVNMSAIIGLAIISLATFIGIIFLTLWTPSIILDDIGVFEGLKRGAKAVKHHFWSILGTILLFGIIMALIVNIVNKLYTYISGTASYSISPFNYMSILSTLIFICLATILTAYFYIIYDNFKPTEMNDEEPSTIETEQL